MVDVTALGEDVRIGVAQAGLRRGPAELGLDGPAKHAQGLLVLTHVVPEAGLDEDQFDVLRRPQRGRMALANGPQRLVVAAHGALAVGDDGQVLVAAGHAGHGPVLGERCGVVLRRVGGLRGRLTDHGQTGRAPTGGPGMPVRQRGILVDQFARGDEVGHDLAGQVERKTAEFGAHRPRQQPFVEVEIDLGLAVGTLQTGGRDAFVAADAIVVTTPVSAVVLPGPAPRAIGAPGPGPVTTTPTVAAAPGGVPAGTSTALA